MVLTGTLPAGQPPLPEPPQVTERWKWQLGIGVAVAGALILVKLVASGLGQVEEASGFVFADRGTTVKTRLIGMRYEGNEWEPVLIVWSDRYQDSSLDGGVIGRGGSGTIDVNGRLRYVAGKVSLDSSVREPFATQMVLEHELGHVLGLDHTDDPQQLMYPSVNGQRGFGNGDIDGLKRLHDVPCD